MKDDRDDVPPIGDLDGKSTFLKVLKKTDLLMHLEEQRDRPPNGVISVSTNFISQSIIKSCSFQTVIKLANIYELSIYRKYFLMAVIRKRKKPYF